MGVSLPKLGSGISQAMPITCHLISSPLISSLENDLPSTKHQTHPSINHPESSCSGLRKDTSINTISNYSYICSSWILNHHSQVSQSRFCLTSSLTSNHIYLEMNGPLRSKQGCWTCRLRRKKCDERHPTCITCDSLEITCYGYGTKPDFMDGGDKEREVKSRIRDIVKTTSRKKGRLGISIRKFGTRRGASHDVETGHVEKTGQLKIAPKDDKAGTDVSSPASSSEPHRSDSASQSHGTSNTSHSPRSESLQDNRQASSVPPIPTNEAVLLMHFLDNVFPIQYPMYKPTVVEGGRGWFLSLLLRTKPLYHAALALSSFHTGTAIYGAAQIRAGENWRGCPEEEKHIQIALIAFREELENIGTWMQTRCPRDSLGFLGCTIQLIYFEVSFFIKCCIQKMTNCPSYLLDEGTAGKSTLWQALLCFSKLTVER